MICDTRREVGNAHIVTGTIINHIIACPDLRAVSENRVCRMCGHIHRACIISFAEVNIGCIISYPAIFLCLNLVEDIVDRNTVFFVFCSIICED